MQNELHGVIERALTALMSRRDPRGFWEGRLSSSPLATAVALCAFADEETLPPEKIEKAFAYLDSTQNADGGWGDTEISKSNLAATLLALSATGAHKRAESDSLKRARDYVEKLGGMRDGLRRVYGKDLTFQVPIRLTAACAGLIPWSDVDALPFELALAPRGLMGALRLPVVSYALPALVCVGLARHVKKPSWFFPLRWLRSFASERALNLILKMQPASGGYLEAIPITAFCLLGLKAAGRSEHAIAEGARKFLLATQRDDGAWPVEVNLSVWNTTRAIDTLAAGGLLEKAMTKQERDATRDWILAQQTKEKSVYSDAAPGGWGWNHLSGSVPDADDTAGAILALRELGVSDRHEAIQTGRFWLDRLQNRNGGWPTFCRGWEKLPFDKSAPDLTAHALRALGQPEYSPMSAPNFDYDCAVSASHDQGWHYLYKNQCDDGSFAPLWFGSENAHDQLNRTYGTCHVIFACMEEGVEPLSLDTLALLSRIGITKAGGKHRSIFRSALPWLRSIQNPDGGFGGCAGAPSSAEETGLALRALASCGVDISDIPDIAGHREAMARAARWLAENQLPNGSWKPSPIGFYFAVLWYYEQLYPLYYALGGLGAYLKNAEKYE